MAKKRQKIDLKKINYEILPDTQYSVKNEVVTIIRDQNHWIQRMLRKVWFKIPEKSYLELDNFGSFVFLKVKKHENVYQIGQELSAEYEDTNELLYERLLVFLNHLEKNEKLIRRI